MKKITNYFKNTLKVGFLILTALIVNTAAATFTVTNTSDSGAGSLRQAVLDANAAAGADTIVFDPGVFSTPQTITLTGGELLIADSADANVTITGPGANLLTVNGGGTSRIFTILQTPVVSISGMTLTGGNGVGSEQNDAGGAIYNLGDLTLSSMVITGNTTTGFGGGVVSLTNDTLTVMDSTFSNNTSGNQGGAISVNGSQFLSITNSTFSGNLAAREGGALFVSGLGVSAPGPITITGSTFSNNHIIGPSPTGGGGIGFFNLTANITNSTISGNTSASNGGGIRSYRTTLTISYSTIASNTTNANGGGISRLDSGSVTFLGTIIGNNTASGSGPDLSGTAFISGGYNLIENTSGATISGTLTGNITGDPMLDPLGNYGGPTFTHRLKANSPAIDAGDTGNFPATDQRGVPRPIDGNPGNLVAQPDIGAFEAAAPTAASVTVSGRVSNGIRGIPNAMVVITDFRGNTRQTQTNHFGYFRFTEVETGQTYIVSVLSKQYKFTPQAVSVSEKIADLEFVTKQVSKSNERFSIYVWSPAFTRQPPAKRGGKAA